MLWWRSWCTGFISQLSSISWWFLRNTSKELFFLTYEANESFQRDIMSTWEWTTVTCVLEVLDRSKEPDSHHLASRVSLFLFLKVKKHISLLLEVPQMGQCPGMWCSDGHAINATWIIFTLGQAAPQLVNQKYCNSLFLGMLGRLTTGPDYCTKPLAHSFSSQKPTTSSRTSLKTFVPIPKRCQSLVSNRTSFLKALSKRQAYSGYVSLN